MKNTQNITNIHHSVPSKRMFILAFRQIILACSCMILLTLTTCRVDKDQPKAKDDSHMLSGKDYDQSGGADAYACGGDHFNSIYYGNPDYYSLQSDSSLIIIPHFKTMQQTTEWSCGDVCALLLLHHFGCDNNLTEWDLAKALRSMTNRSISDAKPGSAQDFADYGTHLEDLYNYFYKHPQLKIVASSYRLKYANSDIVKSGDPFPQCDYGNLYPTFQSINAFSAWLTVQLRANRPVMVEWSDWDGHWDLIIGIDFNGTPNFTGDDTLIFADPYDTSDHRQDGYSIAPLERFFYSWKDRAIAPKPYQLQPFIVVDKR